LEAARRHPASVRTKEPKIMSTRKGWSCWLVAAALLPLIPAQAQAQTTAPLTLDEEYARKAEEVPGFGGLYLDEDGVTHIYLTDVSREKEVQDWAARVTVQQGDYDFRDLFAWKDEVRPLLAERGAVTLDIDERRNRLVFGVERASLEDFDATLKRFLEDTHVPSEAVLTEATDPIEPLELLTDRIRPVPAGVQIQNAGGGKCTLGVNATRQGVKGFVTNSHCTAVQSLVEGTSFFQNTGGSINFIGTETVDPFFFHFGSCPLGRACRLSDSAFVAYSSSALSAGGKIANPTCSFVQGSLTVSSQTPRLPVTGVMFVTPVAGSIVNKVGKTTGCTFGFTIGTCVDSNVKDSIFTMLCQNQVAGVANHGDSGSPVFFHGHDHATLTGILWGGIANSTYFYSPWTSVVLELGAVIPDAP